ncbi:MAG: transporter substrate-binding domain-containing protein [Gemmatimonadetes bacterium]|nr:transporter substrate-binding domain-containing protein [Gemmatimonadota bacterium]
MRRYVPTLLLILTSATAACGGDDPGPPVERDLQQIADMDTLTALVTFNSTSYFLYRGEPMGFEYDLLRAFAEDAGLELRTVIARDRDRVLHRLNDGDGDVAAARIVPTRRDSPHVAYTEPLYQTRAMLVQQGAPPESADLPQAVDTLLPEPGSAADDAPEAGDPAPLNVRARLLQRPSQLAGREVHMPDRTFYEDRLIELSDSLGEDIHVVEVDSASHEQLIRSVSQGRVQFTVSPENLARLKESYFSNVVVTPVLGPTHDVTLAVRNNAPELKRALDSYIERARETGELQALYDKYFRDRAGIDERIESEYLTSETGRLSEYDDLLRQHAPAIGWDWRLLASQTFQESKFQPRARSWAGAMGLLQLMPATAREVNVADAYDPEQNVAGAVRYLEWLSALWENEIADPEQRLRFILASYNAGFGHVSDARRLAEKNGDDPDRWDDVAYWLLQKSKKDVYTDPVVEYGFCRGLEPVTYVALVLERYAHYQEFVAT